MPIMPTEKGNFEFEFNFVTDTDDENLYEALLNAIELEGGSESFVFGDEVEGENSFAVTLVFELYVHDYPRTDFLNAQEKGYYVFKEATSRVGLEVDMYRGVAAAVREDLVLVPERIPFDPEEEEA